MSELQIEVARSIIAGLKEAGYEIVPIATRPCPEWLPIASAPKDGTAILLFERAEFEQFVGYWSRGNRCFTPFASNWKTMPTHWKPLDKPPQVSSVEQEAGS